MAEQIAKPPPTTNPEQNPSAITPELVQEITDKVYAMLLADLRIERERLRLTQPAWHRQGRHG